MINRCGRKISKHTGALCSWDLKTPFSKSGGTMLSVSGGSWLTRSSIYKARLSCNFFYRNWDQAATFSTNRFRGSHFSYLPRHLSRKLVTTPYKHGYKSRIRIVTLQTNGNAGRRLTVEERTDSWLLERSLETEIKLQLSSARTLFLISSPKFEQEARSFSMQTWMNTSVIVIIETSIAGAGWLPRTTRGSWSLY